MADDTSRISVSRDALRADLAEMELRLRVYFDDRLRHKADEADMVALRIVSEKWERGEFTDAQLRAIDARIEAATEGRVSKRWTRRDQVSAALSAATALAMLVLTILLSAKGALS